jgi:sodium-dependent dicarboxylate transporter 2/3/5
MNDFPPVLPMVLRKSLRSVAIVLSVAAMAAAVPAVFSDTLDWAQQITLGIFLFAAGLWVTEVIPPFATAVSVIILQVFLLGRPGGPLNLDEHGITTSYQIFINPVASPVIILFFGGFILAAAAGKSGLDRVVAGVFLRRVAKGPGWLLAGVMGVTAVFSMFMSNTATAVMMFAILAPMLASLHERDPFRKGLCLAVAFAANIGGMGTLIGSPPNAVAASVLASMGIPVSFLGWMLFGVPVMSAMLVILWCVLRYSFPLQGAIPLVAPPRKGAISPSLIVVSTTFALTIGLWMTEPLHEMPAPVVALVPILVFTTTGLLTAEDLKKLDWDVLLLVAGGLSLGVSLQQSGLSEKIASTLHTGGLPPFLLLAGFMAGTSLLSNFMSNTSAANIMIPLAVAVSTLPPFLGAIVVAMSASLAMSLPISTPPNALAYGRGVLTTADLIRTGTLITIIGLAIVIAFFWGISQWLPFDKGW